ncbi:MAG TPA: leucyl/phenylalanyl-tRNA--protein transferase [Dermatophilaceae bacterium]|nr:leucyl/phenylalanyl-tRNA--protein transferase [Dermatophilaceae bacterium]
MPRDPGPSAYRFDADRLGQAAPGEDLVGVGADLEPATLLAAYRAGVFPMGLGRNGRRPLGWWSPDPRGVIPVGGLHVSRSLRRSARRFRVSVDADFRGVLAGCGDGSRPGRWITPAIAAAYTRLHELGWAHSVEVWAGDELAGGVYGVAIGGLFAGESMFHRRTDASKVAVLALHELLDDGVPGRLFDVQWVTPHLASLGARELSRADYLRALSAALTLPAPAGLG